MNGNFPIPFTPIPKKGDTNDIENYRGIAMQSVLPKIFDAALTKKIYDHLESIIPACQHGFMKKRSTATNLAEITNTSNKNRVDVLYFDFSKAFDRVDHAILAEKITKLAMPYSLYSTVMNFISHRIYQIKADGTIYSEKFIAPSSVPQGTHCGPLLYLLL